MERLNQQKVIFIFLGILGFILISLIIVLNVNDTNAKEVVIEKTIQTNEITVEKKMIHVDVKGAVKNPGVYEVDSSSIVNDVIKLAGGITSSGTTKNINLSKKVYDEMVIYVFKNSEITTTAKNEISCTTEVIEVNNCITSSNSEEKNLNKKININTADKTELMGIPGVGEAKAKAIIEYREKTPFKTIEEIKNISGIGDAVFDKIKDLITV